jgi:hypothetical protein
VAKHTEPPTRITPQDLEDKFRALQGGLNDQVESKKTSIASVAAGAGVIVLVIMFLLGRRSGKKRSAVVEIRRI